MYKPISPADNHRPYDLVIFSNSRWDDEYSSSAFSLAKQFALTHRVFYIDFPFTLNDYVTKQKSGSAIRKRKRALWGRSPYIRTIDGLPEQFKVVTPPLVLPVNWLPKGNLYNWLSAINDKILNRTLKACIKDCHIEQFVFINIFAPFYFRNMPAAIRPALQIYYTVDDISQERYIARHGTYLERAAMQQADLVLATSHELVRLAAAVSSTVHYLPNAADTNLFNRAASFAFPKPAELAGCHKKIICYTGNIGTRLDYELLQLIASTNPDKCLLLIGPLSTGDYQKYALDKMPNVIFTGPKDIRSLPAYLYHSHCTIIPFEYSTLTKSIYPLKINEYLAAGKPVVTTAFSKDILEFDDVAYIAVSQKDFLQQVNLAIAEDNEEKRNQRMQRARQNTWEARTRQFWQIVNNHFNKTEEA